MKAPPTARQRRIRLARPPGDGPPISFVRRDLSAASSRGPPPFWIAEAVALDGQDRVYYGSRSGDRPWACRRRAVAMREALLMATGIAVSPISIVAVVLILTTPRARTSGPLFLVGWVFGLAMIVLLVAAFAGDRKSGGARWVGVVDLVAAALLLLVAVRTVLRRQRAGTPVSVPRWIEVLDRAPPHATLGMGMAVVVVNPKNFLLAVGGSLAIADADVAGRARALVYVAFLVIGTMGVALPLVLYLAAGARALTALLRLRNWLARYNSPVTLVVCLLVAAVFAHDAVALLDGR